MNLLDSFLLPFKPGNSEGNDTDDKDDQGQEEEHNVVVENVLTGVLHDGDSVVEHVIGGEIKFFQGIITVRILQ